jgi:hypothetical protein
VKATKVETLLNGPILAIIIAMKKKKKLIKIVVIIASVAMILTSLVPFLAIFFG